MVGNNENILVEFDYQNIVLVDPNKTIDSDGNVKERLLKHENLVYYANLECSLFPRTRLSQSSSGNVDVKTISMDDFVEKNKIENLGGIKIDVEGHELKAIQGGLNTLKKFRPFLMIEIEEFKDYGRFAKTTKVRVFVFHSVYIIE